jgi:tetratricopeptide (TPR) repeat protein
MEAQQRSPFGFAQSRLPWFVAVGALLLYAVTLNHWVRLESLPTVARLTSESWAASLHAPLYFLLTGPVRLLPVSAQPVALNVLSAVLAALTLALLARSVSLLPYDRTSDTRWLESNPFSLLTHPPAWLPATFAVLLCGLQLTFWEHATAATGEMLDLLLFASLVRCLLEYRLSRRDVWLYQFAFTYGLAVTNNYALIAYSPGFLVALVWIMEASFFRVAFLGRMVALGLAGLLLYLLLPAVATWSGDSPASFWQNLRALLGTQKGQLLGFPRFQVLLMCVTSILPLMVVGVRWTGGLGDHSAAGAALATLIMRVVYFILLIGSVSNFFDLRGFLSPRFRGLGLPFLPLYYVSALCAGYFVGYFLLVFGAKRPALGRRPAEAPPAAVGFTGIVLLVGAAVCGGLLVQRNLAIVRFSNGEALAQLADLLFKPVLGKPAGFIGDTPTEVLLAQARAVTGGARVPHVFVNSGLLPFPAYHRQLAAKYGTAWRGFQNLDPEKGPVMMPVVVAWLAHWAQSNTVYYLSPSFGEFFEVLQLRPRGLAYALRPLASGDLLPPALTAEELGENQKFWEAAEPVLGCVLVQTNQINPDGDLVAGLYSRALNYWGVTLQRHERVADAAKWFELALRLQPANLAARTNLAFNAQLRGGQLDGAEMARALEGPLPSKSQMEQLLVSCGPFDQPAWLYRVGQISAQSSLYRQALVAFDRLHRLFPTNASLGLWRQNMEIMTRFELGDAAGAESLARALEQERPREDSVLEALTQIYLLTSRYSNALVTVEKQLALNPANQRALLNEAAICIQLKEFAKAIPPLDKLLSLRPDNRPALMNRAIAHLQSEHLDQAQQDYEALRKVMPRYHPVFYGLGEIAYRRKNTAAALENYELYLKYGRKESEEYKVIAQRVQELRGVTGR